jgi:glycosyltransferase involved in cell wall biosynthesis
MISTHIVLKENTNLALLFLKCCLNSLKETKWCDELIIIDNGCSDPIKEHLRDFQKDFHCPVKLIEDRSTIFCDLRNKALSLTNPNAKYFHWIDGDEVLIPEEWKKIKEVILRNDVGQVNTYGVHFMITPKQTQYTFTKDNIFRYHKYLHWGKGVHEKIQNVLPGQCQSDTHYLHFGYCKQQWRTCLKWYHYDMIEFGHVGRYKDEMVDGKVIDYHRDWRNPNNILFDRLKECKDYTGPRPEVAMPIFEHQDKWEEFISSIDDQSFWTEWQKKFKKAKSWRNTLDWVVTEMGSRGWNLV